MSSVVVNENGRNATLFWASHGVLVPTGKRIVKDPKTHKNKTLKYTIQDSQNSFIYVVKSIQQVDEYIHHITHIQRDKPIQPFILCVGGNILEIEEIFSILIMPNIL